MQIQQALSPNFRQGRKGRTPIAIVNHQTAGQFPGCLNWMCNPLAQASAHYLVTRAGAIYQLVRGEDTAWHAGGVNRPSWSLYDGSNPNNYTLGIEHECYPDVGGDGNLTESQYQATLWLHQQLVAKWGIPIDSDHIIGHYRIDSVNRPGCPGSAFPWDRLLSDLKGVSKDMKASLDIPDVKVVLNGKAIDKTVLLNVDGKDTTYIPAVVLRDVGMAVSWDSATKTVLINK